MKKETINVVLRLNEELAALKAAEEKLSLGSTVLAMFDDYYFKRYETDEYHMEDILRNAKINVIAEVKERIASIEQELEEL